MPINQPTAAAHVQSRSARRRWLVFPSRRKRTAAVVWSSEAELLRALGECRSSPRGSPSNHPELPLQRPPY